MTRIALNIPATDIGGATSSPPERTIKSFALRKGRLTESQKSALEQLLPRYELACDRQLDQKVAFGRTAPLVMEIGFGDGTALLELALRHPEWNFIGAEVHRPGVGRLLREAEARGLENIRVCCEDAVVVLRQMIPERSLAGLNIFFPDPWHKKRHHKRRLINPDFIRLVSTKLATGGQLHLATDWADYAASMLAIADASADLENLAGPGHYRPGPGDRPLTKFERRGQVLGHATWDLIYVRN